MNMGALMNIAIRGLNTRIEAVVPDAGRAGVYGDCFKCAIDMTYRDMVLFRRARHGETSFTEREYLHVLEGLS